MKKVILMLSVLLLACIQGVRAQDSIGATIDIPQARPLPQIASVQDSTVPPPDFTPVEKEPMIIHQVIPIYPASAIKDHLEGRVIVKLWITASGKPHQVVILRSSNDIFNQPATDAAMKYRFTPAILHNKPVAVWVVIPFTFKLKPDSESTKGGTKRIETSRLNAAAPGVNSDAVRLSNLISQYNMGMYHERLKEYRKAVESYKNFLREAKETNLKADEMVQHAREMVKKYSKEQDKRR